MIRLLDGRPFTDSIRNRALLVLVLEVMLVVLATVGCTESAMVGNKALRKRMSVVDSTVSWAERYIHLSRRGSRS